MAMINLPKILIVVVVIAGLYSPKTLATTKIDNLKAAFVYQFAKYTQWPDYASKDITFCSFEHQIINEALAKLTNKRVKQRTVKVRYLSDVSKINSACQVLFISGASQYDIKQILANTATMPILTVGDGEHFMAQGGMIALSRRGIKQRFIINNHRTAAANLKLSSKLLQLALPFTPHN